MGFLEDQLSNDDAYKNTMEQMHELVGSDEEPLLWYALAETQWKVGRLTADIKENALDWIDKKGGLEPWIEEGGKGAGWLKTLAKLKEKLESPMPKEKKVKKPEEVATNPWNPNDIYAYQFNSKKSEEKGLLGKYMLMQKIGEGQFWYGKAGYKPVLRVQVMDKIFDELPTLDDFDGLRILPLDWPTRVNISGDYLIERDNYTTKKESIWMSTIVITHKKSDYPKKHLTFIGNKQGSPNTRSNNREFSWFSFESLPEYYECWQGVEYDTVGEGEYEYTQEGVR